MFDFRQLSVFNGHVEFPKLMKYFKYISSQSKFNLNSKVNLNSKFKATSIVQNDHMGISKLLIHTIIAIYITKYICYYNKINITMLISHKVHSINCSLNVHFKMQNFIHLVQNIIHQVQNIMPAGLQKHNTLGKLEHMGGDRI